MTSPFEKEKGSPQLWIQKLTPSPSTDPSALLEADAIQVIDPLTHMRDACIDPGVRVMLEVMHERAKAAREHSIIHT